MKQTGILLNLLEALSWREFDFGKNLTNMSEVETVIEGPTPGVSYPIKVDYCPNCSLPFEVCFYENFATNFSFFISKVWLQYCEYYPDYENCKKWLEKNMPERFATLNLEDGGEEGADVDGKTKRQTRGGKG